jgi:hypothetical protein
MKFNVGDTIIGDVISPGLKIPGEYIITFIGENTSHVVCSETKAEFTFFNGNIEKFFKLVKAVEVPFEKFYNDTEV